MVKIETHEQKIDLIERIRDAIKAAKIKLDELTKEANKNKTNVDKQNKAKYMGEHVSILNALLSKTQSFNIIDHLESKKGGESSDGKKTFHIDDNT